MSAVKAITKKVDVALALGRSTPGTGSLSLSSGPRSSPPSPSRKSRTASRSEDRSPSPELTFKDLGVEEEKRTRTPDNDSVVFTRLTAINPLPAYYNVVGYKNNQKFQKVLENTARSKGSSHVLSGRARKERRLRKVNEMLENKLGEYLEQRLLESTLSRQNRYVRLGDEYRLRATLLHDNILVNERDGTSGRTLIAEAAAYGQYSIARLLCSEYRVDVNKPTMIGGSTPLHLAVGAGYRQICSLLITYGANVDAVDNFGNTPFHLFKKRSILKLLLKSEADPLIKNKAGMNPFECYMKNTLDAMPADGLLDGRKVLPEDIRSGDVIRELSKYTEREERERLRRDQALAKAFEEELASISSSMKEGTYNPHAARPITMSGVHS